MATDTVEWGSDANPRPRRWSGGPRSGQPRFAGPVPVRRVLPVAIGLAILGFALTLAAEMLPWRELQLNDSLPNQLSDVVGPYDTSQRLSDLLNSQGFAYYVNLTALFGLIALAIFGSPAVRRVAILAGFGAAAGHAVLLAGVLATINDHTIGFNVPVVPDDVLGVTVGSGFYSGVAGLALLVVVLVLMVWSGATMTQAMPAGAAPETAAANGSGGPSGADDRSAEAPAGIPAPRNDELPEAPADLTVAPATPFRDDRSPYAR